MSQFIPLGPVKPRYCPGCKIIATQMCDQICDPMITTETRTSPPLKPSGNIPPRPTAIPIPTKEEIALARSKLDLAKPIVKDDGSLVFHHLPKLRYSNTPYTRVYPTYGRTGNIFGPLERNFKDDRVFKEGSFTPKKRQPRTSSKSLQFPLNNGQGPSGVAANNGQGPSGVTANNGQGPSGVIANNGQGPSGVTANNGQGPSGVTANNGQGPSGVPANRRRARKAKANIPATLGTAPKESQDPEEGTASASTSSKNGEGSNTTQD